MYSAYYKHTHYIYMYAFSNLVFFFNPLTHVTSSVLNCVVLWCNVSIYFFRMHKVTCCMLLVGVLLLCLVGETASTSLVQRQRQIFRYPTRFCCAFRRCGPSKKCVQYGRRCRCRPKNGHVLYSIMHKHQGGEVFNSGPAKISI